ncbi:hypothetical protein [Halobellus sp. EA9]|uniref:hypothetical protein n=1 Tax=Halobellus sp. EA9 TaxID=3421647 RepID=UPI003EC0C188
MEKRDSNQQESIDSPNIEDVNQLKLAALGAGAAVCQRCGKPLQGGEHVFAYVFRRCPHAAWLAGQTRCADHSLELDTLASLGVREYIVSGRIGHCIDHVLQREFPVLLAPKLEATSPRDTETAFDLPSVTPADVTDCPIAETTFEDTPAYEYAEATR